MNRAYQIALACGLVPLVVGTSIFVLWLVTRWNWLIPTGMLTIAAGMVVVGTGLVALLRYVWISRDDASVKPRRRRLATLLCAALLLVNFPAAAGITVAAIAIETSYTVIVHNATDRPLQNVHVVGGGRDIDLGTIGPRGSARRRFWIKHDGILELSAMSGAHPLSEQIDGYVTSGMGGRTTVTVGRDAKVTIQHD